MVLPLKPEENKLNDEFIGLFNQLKADFSHARYLWYITTVKDDNISSLSEKNNDLIDLKDTADFSYKEMLLRTSYKLFYSCFDKLGLFINEFYEVGLEGSQISFKNVWKDKINKKSVKNPIKAKFDNSALKTLYWIQKDLAEDNETNVTDPYAMPMCRMRNDMEHNALRTIKNIIYSEKETIFTNYTSEGSIEHNIFRIMKLLRESLICLTIAVNYDTNKNENDGLSDFY